MQGKTKKILNCWMHEIFRHLTRCSIKRICTRIHNQYLWKVWVVLCFQMWQATCQSPLLTRKLLIPRGLHSNSCVQSRNKYEYEQVGYTYLATLHLDDYNIRSNIYMLDLCLKSYLKIVFRGWSLSKFMNDT